LSTVNIHIIYSVFRLTRSISVLILGRPEKYMRAFYTSAYILIYLSVLIHAGTTKLCRSLSKQS